VTRRRKIAAGAIVVLLAALGAILFWPAPPPPEPPLPVPNGYDDLLKAGAMVDVPYGLPAEGNPNALRASLEMHRDALALAREGLAKEFRLPGDSFSAVPLLRLRRLLESEGLLHESEGRASEAARSYRDLVLLGLQMRRGALPVPVLSGTAFEMAGIERLLALRPRLGRQDRLETAGALEGMLPLEEPIEEVLSRHAAFERRFSLYDRLSYQIHVLLDREKSMDERTREASAEAAAHLRILIADLRAHSPGPDGKDEGGHKEKDLLLPPPK
jgi:hypothetical protein